MVENIFWSYTDEDLYSECIMRFYNSTVKRQITQFKKGAKDLNRYFSTKDIRVVSNYMKRSSKSLSFKIILKEMHIKTIKTYHSHLLGCPK